MTFRLIPTRRERIAHWLRTHWLGNQRPLGPWERMVALAVFVWLPLYLLIVGLLVTWSPNP